MHFAQLIGLLRRSAPQPGPAAPATCRTYRDSQTYDYTRPVRGHSVATLPTDETGHMLSAAGCGPKFARMRRGDYVLLRSSVTPVARYRVAHIIYRMHPEGAWDAVFEYDPEENRE
jgi:hypothetical protein